MTPFDLHVLGMPPAFVLSQDQTLMLNSRSKPKPKPGNRQEPFLCALLFVSDTHLSKDKPSKNKDVTYCP